MSICCGSDRELKLRISNQDIFASQTPYVLGMREKSEQVNNSKEYSVYMEKWSNV